MPIARSGAFFEDGETFIYGFSDSSGSLEVTGGDVLTLTSASGNGPFLSAGRPGSGALDPTAIGTISLRDSGTILDVISAGSATDGASLAIARGDDTRGLMQVTDGAMFRLTDPTGPDNSDATGGGESGWIGRGARAEGTLDLRAGEFIFSGTGSNLSVGREGGTGTVSMTEGSGFVMETTSAGAEDFTHLRIGINDGTGCFEIAESFALIQAGQNAGGQVDVGVNGGTGSLAISSSAENGNRDGLFLVGNAYSPATIMNIGALSGTGNVTLEGGTLAVVNSGVEVLRAGGSAPWAGPGEKGGFAAVFIGRDFGEGTLQATDGAQLFIGGRTATELGIGVGGGTGSMVLDASDMILRSFGDEAGLQIGEWQTGGATGTLELRNGATAVVQGADGVFANIGRRAENEGMISILSGSRLDLIGENNTNANMRVGRHDGTGQLDVNGTGSLLRLAGDLTLGREGGTGMGEIANGGAIENQRTGFTSTRIGQHEGSEGRLTLLDGSLLTRSLGMHDARIDIGIEGGQGRMTLGAGSDVTLHAGRHANVEIGSGAGGDGALEAASASQITLQSDMGNVQLDLGRGAQGQMSLSNTRLDLLAPMRDSAETPLDTFAWILVGTEGGTGQAIFDNTEVNLAAGEGAGFRIGTRWSDTEDNTGDGRVTLQNGSVVYAEALQEDTNFWVGGGAGSYGEARILSGSVLDLSGNGWVPVGYAAPGLTPGGEGLLVIDGAGSLLTGVRGLTAGGRGSDGMVQISDGARALIGGLDADRNVFVDFGWRDGSRGELVMANALISVQAGTGANADQPETGTGVNLGTDGGTGLASITGARATDPDAPHGLIVLGHAESDFAFIDIGRGAGSEGNSHVRGAFFGAQNDGTTFGATGPIDLDGDGGYAAVRIGIDGGMGTLDIGGSSELFAISGADDSAEILVGRGDGSSGVLSVSDGTQVDIIARQFDAWLLAGSEGGASGTVTIADSSVLIDAARNGGIRLGTSWFDTPDQVGTGYLDITDGSNVTLRAGGGQTLFHIGGGAGSAAQASLIDSTMTLEGAAHRLVVIGGTPAFLPGTGGQGQLRLEGTSTRLEGARDVTVGVNGGTGTLELRAGAALALVDEGGGVGGRTLLGVGGGRVRSGEANTLADGTLLVTGAGTEITLDAADQAFVAIGTGGGTGRATLAQGARLALEAGVTAVEIGVTGGAGQFDILGAGTELVVGGTDGRIHVGRERNPDATGDGPARGLLRIGDGAEVQVQTKVEIGDSTAHSALLAMEGGRLVTPLVEVYAGTSLQNNMLLGWGEIVGVEGAPSLLLAGSSFFVGDRLAATYDRTTDTGLMQITGNVVAQDSAIHFDILDGADAYDQIQITGSFSMDGGSLDISSWTWTGGEFFTTGYRLLSATDGIFLNDVVLNVLDRVGEMPGPVTTELRNNGTELWAVLEGDGTPTTGVPLPPAWRDWLDWIGGGGGAPPQAPDFGGDSSVVMDPHLVTLDGLAYSFHAAGEFVLMRQLDGPLEVQARMAPVAANASENVAAAVQLDGGRVMIDAAEPNTILVNGAEISLASGDSAAVGTDLVYRTEDTWHMVHRHGDLTGSTLSVISVKVIDGRLDISAFANDVLRGQVEGLWGNFDGNPDTDLALQDGRLVARPLQFGDDPETGTLGLYGAFRDDWRVAENSESLFFYAPGQGPDSFYLPDYPAAMVTLEDFDPDALAEAEALVAASGLQPGSVAFDNALFDLLSTGNESYVAGAVAVQAQRDARPETAPTPSAPDIIGGTMEGLVGLTGQLRLLPDRDAGDVQITFTPDGRIVSHIRKPDTEGGFRFDLMEGSSGTLSATRSFDPTLDPRVDALDALDVLRLAVGLAPSWGTASALNFIAADIDQNGQVTALDALEVLRAAVGLDSAHQPRWIFMDEDTDLSAIDRNNTQVDTSLAISDLGEGIGGISMLGILLGNMQEMA